MGSAAAQSTLWGAAVRAWAQICEPWSRPLYLATFAALAPLPDLTLLDAGCGSGLALRLAADQGARVTGMDATEPMLVLARERLPDADLRVGDIQDLPFDDAAFDAVTAFNAVQYAADPQQAAMEMARVTRPGGQVAIGVWGDPARCETEAIFQQVRKVAPPPPGAATPLAISTAGVVEELLVNAGLVLTTSGEVDCPFSYPDLETGWRGQSSIGPFRSAIETAGEDTVRKAFIAAAQQFRQPDGTYRQDNVFRYVLARKPA
jgi:SAM-dependent methyltransferase